MGKKLTVCNIEMAVKEAKDIDFIRGKHLEADGEEENWDEDNVALMFVLTCCVLFTQFQLNV